MKRRGAYARLSPDEAARRFAADCREAGLNVTLVSGGHVSVSFASEAQIDSAENERRLALVRSLSEEFEWDSAPLWNLLKEVNYDGGVARSRIIGGATESTFRKKLTWNSQTSEGF